MDWLGNLLELEPETQTCRSSTKDSTPSKTPHGESTAKSCPWLGTCGEQAVRWEVSQTPSRIRYLNDQLGWCPDCPRARILKHNPSSFGIGRDEPQESRKVTTCAPASLSNGSQLSAWLNSLRNSRISGSHTTLISVDELTQSARDSNRKAVIYRGVFYYLLIVSLLGTLAISGWLFMGPTV